jgi:hypothetical protein
MSFIIESKFQNKAKTIYRNRYEQSIMPNDESLRINLKPLHGEKLEHC